MFPGDIFIIATPLYVWITLFNEITWCRYLPAQPRPEFSLNLCTRGTPHFNEYAHARSWYGILPGRFGLPSTPSMAQSEVATPIRQFIVFGTFTFQTFTFLWEWRLSSGDIQRISGSFSSDRCFPSAWRGQ